MFHICDESLAPGEKSNFTGTVKLDNYILYSEADSPANADANNDILAIRKPGAVQLIVEDDALRNAKVDLTRAHTVNAADNGTVFEGKERMDLYHILLVQKDAVLAGLQGDLIGKTQDSEYYGKTCTVGSEVDTLRVLTNSNSTLTLDVNGTEKLYFAGVFGTASTYGSATSGKVTAASRETLSLTKTGAGAQYIHTAAVNRLVLQEGTLGFNSLNVKTSAVLYGGTNLNLGVTRGIASDGTAQEWGAAGGGMTINPGYALHIVTDRTVNAGTGAGAVAVPETAVVNGSVTVSDSSFLYFDCSILPSELQEHPLLAVKGLEDIADSGRLNLNGDILVRFGGYDFGEADTVDKKYYLATTESGIYVDGALGGFQTRTISIGNGWFGIIKVSGDNMNLVMTVTNTPIRTWYNGENRSEGEYVAATDNVWFANELPEGEGTDRNHWLEGLDKNLGLNGFYRDTYHVAFGAEGAGKTGMVEREEGKDYNVVLIRGEVRPASIRVKDDVNYIFRAHADGGLIADGELPDDYETSNWKTILTKDGAGTLVMETANTYSGGTEINGGRVVMRDAGALGTGEIRMFDGTSLALDYQSGGFIQKVALLNNLLTVAEDSVVTVSHTDRVIGGVISTVRGDSTANLVLQHANGSGQTVFQLDDGSKFHGKISMSGTQDGQGTVQACLDRNTWEEAGFDLSLNGVQSTILHLDSVEDVHHITLAGIMGQDEASFVTTEASAGRDSSTTLFLAVGTQDRIYCGNVGFGQYIDMYDTGLRHDSGYISLVKTGIFSQTVGNARLASLQIDAGSLKVVNTLLLAGELSVAQDGNLVVGHDEWQGLYDYDVQVNDGGVLRLGSGFGSLTGTPYTEDGVQKTGNTILLNGGGVLGMLDADWSNENEMVVNAGGKAFVLDTTGYDPELHDGLRKQPCHDAQRNRQARRRLRNHHRQERQCGQKRPRGAGRGQHLGRGLPGNGPCRAGAGACGRAQYESRSRTPGSGFPPGREGRNGFLRRFREAGGSGSLRQYAEFFLPLRYFRGGDGPHRGRLLHGGEGFSRFFRRSGNRAGSRLRGPRPVQRRQRERQDGSGAGPYGILRLRAGGGRRAGGPRDGHAHSCGGFRHQAGRVFLPGRHWRFHNGCRAEPEHQLCGRQLFHDSSRCVDDQCADYRGRAGLRGLLRRREPAADGVLRQPD